MGVRSISLALPVQSTPFIILPMEYTSLYRGDALLLDATLLMVGIRVTALLVRLQTMGNVASRVTNCEQYQYLFQALYS